MDIVIQPVGKTDELPLDGLAGGVLVHGIRGELLIGVVNGRIPFAFPVTPSLSFFRITLFTGFYLIDILPFEAELVHLFQGAVVLVLEGALDAVLQPAGINHGGMGKLLAPFGGTGLPTVAAGVKPTLREGHLEETPGEGTGCGGELRSVVSQPARQGLPARLRDPLRTKFCKAYFWHRSLFFSFRMIVCTFRFFLKAEVK